jgi:23S rRNA pseudouridine1911/1915/1917 synthase
MRPKAFRFVVTETGERLDRLVADAAGCGRRTVRRWVAEGRVRVNGHFAAAADIPAVGSEVLVEDQDPPAAMEAVPGPLAVVFENERFAVVAKPAGLHCERGRSPGTLADLVEARYGDLSQAGDRGEEAGLVHRIDRDTSGAVVVARDRATWLRLRRAFSSGRTRKRYLALASGRLAFPRVLDAPLARRGAHMTVAGRYDDALEAVTDVEPLECGNDWTLVLATMTTGAMHQIRVHLASIGHPLFGDSTYDGPPLAGSARSGQHLHALRVEIAGEMDVSVPPPEDFLAAYAMLRRGGGATSSS